MIILSERHSDNGQRHLGNGQLCKMSKSWKAVLWMRFRKKNLTWAGSDNEVNFEVTWLLPNLLKISMFWAIGWPSCDLKIDLIIFKPHHVNYLWPSCIVRLFIFDIWHITQNRLFRSFLLRKINEIAMAK